ncbi:MAG TPA: hypothetical protein VGF45_18545 [Polyangia bacterium]
MTPREERHLQKLEARLDQPARESLFALLPKRTLAKVAFLLLLLVGIIYLKGRTDVLVRLFEPAAKPTPAKRFDPATNTEPVPSSPR